MCAALGEDDADTSGTAWEEEDEDGGADMCGKSVIDCWWWTVVSEALDGLLVKLAS